MELKNIRLTVEDKIADLVIHRPEALNALDRATLKELDHVFDQLAGDDAVRVIVITGAGEKAFVAGADIKELARNTPLQSSRHAALGQAVLGKLEAMGKPSIAAINGFALGGGLELALACTLRIASANARLGLPEITLGIIPGFGGTQRLSRLVGRGRALHMILTGKPIAAQPALEFGLVSRVVEPGELKDAARELATQLAAFSAVTLRIAEQTVRGGADLPMAEALAFEASQFGLAASAEDYAEGMQAFLEKRKPAFQGR
jgi:enoyl-CoA hydratase